MRMTENANQCEYYKSLPKRQVEIVIGQNTKHLYNTHTMLNQRRRLWADGCINVIQMDCVYCLHQPYHTACAIPKLRLPFFS